MCRMALWLSNDCVHTHCTRCQCLVCSLKHIAASLISELPNTHRRHPGTMSQCTDVHAHCHPHPQRDNATRSGIRPKLLQTHTCAKGDNIRTSACTSRTASSMSCICTGQCLRLVAHQQCSVAQMLLQRAQPSSTVTRAVMQCSMLVAT